ncbi:hypothetical protein [Stenotrophomonas sp. PS02298]|uniref:hypothetical protein n=1 Tax=Stenotrophomonas sp. PS02298 TaxID=2991424 RepID=UPI002499BD3B|nr:hypothetical protein [Stenotrophomonas sp. PS02298]
MNGKLTRAQLDERLALLEARAWEIMEQELEGERLEAIVGEAEPLETLVNAGDEAYLGQAVERILRTVGAIAQEDDSGER